MDSKRLSRLTAIEATHALARGAITSEALVRACLERVAAREEVVGAWAHLDPDAALREARARDQSPRRGPLHGLPVGIKDIIDTADMPTAYGSSIYAGYRPAADAACVALLREAGAVILGKTVTTEFAALTPGKTTNPHRPTHIPGGSSSGSAAAVADFMVPAALGSQTIGSTIRPATYCGVVGFKPTYRILSLAGVKSQAESLDTLGLLTRAVDDLLLLSNALLGVPQAFDAPTREAPPRLGLCRSPHWPKAQASTIRVMDEAVRLCTAAGASFEEISLSERFDRALDAQWTILSFEFARVLAYERTRHRDRLSERLRTLLDAGMEIPVADYHAALAVLAACRAEIAPVFERVDALLTPAAAGEAPEGLQSQSDLLFQRLWTALHLPAITLPGFRGETGLPVGIQLVGRAGADGLLLSVARWAEALLPKGSAP